MVSMCSALRQIKDDPFAVLSPAIVQEVCEQFGHTWREGPLKPQNTVALFVQQIIEGNASCAEVRHFAGQAFSPSAYCQARQRLPLEVLRDLSRRVHDAVARWTAKQAAFTWRGHRTWAVDGSTFSMPDTPELQEHFGQPRGQKAGCGFPVAHLLAMFDLHSGLLAEPIASPLYTSDLRHTPLMHAQMGEGDILLGDDTFSTYAHFALILRNQLHALMPNHHRRIVNFTPRRRHAHPADPHAPAGPATLAVDQIAG